MRHLDLFSGIGGFALAARTVGWQTIGFCECDPYCQAVLQRHWPDVPIYDDVRTLDGNAIGPVDVISGGFPCQDISVSMPFGDGIRGERSGLWSEFARLTGELRPGFVVVENVAALLARGMGVVCGDLARLGYDAEWSVISACAMGAPHSRRRVFLVAYPDSVGRRSGFWDSAARDPLTLQAIDSLKSARAHWRTRLANPSELYGGADGVPNGLHRNTALGNAIVPKIAEIIFSAINASQAQT